MEHTENDRGNLLKGLAAGVVGGLVASAVMNQFQKLCSQMILGEESSHGAQSLQEGSPRHGIGRALHEAEKDDSDDDSAERLSNAFAVGLTGHELTEREKDIAGTAFHYAFGGSMGAVYGIAADTVPAITTGAGAPYGALIWLGADEGVVPLMGLSKTADEYPVSIHASALAAHLVYGLTLEATRKAVRRIL